MTNANVKCSSMADTVIGFQHCSVIKEKIDI